MMNIIYELDMTAKVIIENSHHRFYFENRSVVHYLPL